MFGILKMLFYSFVAVVVGVFIGTVPVGGRTIADRIVSAYESAPSADRAVDAARSKLDGGRKAAAKAKPVAKAEPKASPEAVPGTRQQAKPAKPLTAGAANSPDRHTDEDRLALDRVIASRSSR